jgi:hypothetical protein
MQHACRYKIRAFSELFDSCLWYSSICQEICQLPEDLSLEFKSRCAMPK